MLYGSCRIVISIKCYSKTAISHVYPAYTCRPSLLSEQMGRYCALFTSMTDYTIHGNSMMVCYCRFITKQ